MMLLQILNILVLVIGVLLIGMAAIAVIGAACWAYTEINNMIYRMRSRDIPWMCDRCYRKFENREGFNDIDFHMKYYHPSLAKGPEDGHRWLREP